MNETLRTIDEINEKIRDGSVVVLTADEMTKYVQEVGLDQAAQEVDAVTTGTFGAMCSSGAFLNFGHSDPPIKITKTWLNDVEAYSGIAAVDAYLGATQSSETLGIEYGGAHVIEDLVKGKTISLKASSHGTDCYTLKELDTEITLEELNQAILCNPRNSYERYNAAINSSEKTLLTYMGKLLPNNGNITYSGAGELSPILNDSKFRTMGIGTKIFLGGGIGHIIGSGTQHSPENSFSTLMVKGDLKTMSEVFLRGATMSGYGPTLYVGIGVPIPILDHKIAENTAISDEQITTNILDYAVNSRARPVIKQTNYAELKSGKVEINGQDVPSSPLSSFHSAKLCANSLKEQIKRGDFFLTKAVESLSLQDLAKPMKQNKVTLSPHHYKLSIQSKPKQPIYIDKDLCVNCGLCLSICPVGVFNKNIEWEIECVAEKCTSCFECRDICPRRAIIFSE